MGKPLTALVIILGCLLLTGDILQDIDFFSHSEMRTVPKLLAMSVRNLILVAALVGLGLGQRWAGPALLVVALLGLLRRSSFVAGAWTSLMAEGVGGTLFTGLLSGADIAFRVLLIGVGIELWRRSEE